MLTCDSLFDGRLIVYQTKDGYRFSIDSVLLAGLTRVEAHDRIIDLGTGCGVIPLILAFKGFTGHCVGVEIQSGLAALARKNVQANGFEQHIEIREMDFSQVADHFPPESFELLISNPPYRQLQSGRINPNRERAMARHELVGSIEGVFTAGKFLLPHGGRVAVIYPAARLDHLLSAARHFGFSPKVLVMIYSAPSTSAKLVHLESRKGGGDELKIEPPLFIYQQNGSYSERMRRLYAGE